MTRTERRRKEKQARWPWRIRRAQRGELMGGVIVQRLDPRLSGLRVSPLGPRLGVYETTAEAIAAIARTQAD